jgi:hypothetical protein
MTSAACCTPHRFHHPHPHLGKEKRVDLYFEEKTTKIKEVNQDKKKHTNQIQMKMSANDFHLLHFSCSNFHLTHQIQGCSGEHEQVLQFFQRLALLQSR